MLFLALAAAGILFGFGSLRAPFALALADDTPKPAASAKPAAPPGDAGRGKAVYEKNCVPCHKQDGTGGIRLIPTGNLSRNFRSPDFWKDKTDAQLQTAIETGFPKSGMVSWKGVLKPQEIRDVIAYLHARFQPKDGGSQSKSAESKSTDAKPTSK